MGFRAGRQNLLRETGQPLAPTDWDVFDAKPTETGQPLAPTDWAQRYFGLVELSGTKVSETWTKVSETCRMLAWGM